jgi:hypothetical protein
MRLLPNGQGTVLEAVHYVGSNPTLRTWIQEFVDTVLHKEFCPIPSDLVA